MNDAQDHYQPLIVTNTVSPQNSINSRQLHSILKDSEHRISTERTDSFGEVIKPHGNHRIRFKKDLETIIRVENWKEYNVDVSQEQGCASCVLI